MIVLDASVWVSWLLTADLHYPSTGPWLDQYLLDGGLVAGPALLLIEVASAIGRRSTSRAGEDALEYLQALPGLRLLTVDRAYAASAARLGVALGLRGADATYVAAAHELSSPLVSWDHEQLQRARSTVVTHTPDSIQSTPR